MTRYPFFSVVKMSELFKKIQGCVSFRKVKRHVAKYDNGCEVDDKEIAESVIETCKGLGMTRDEILSRPNKAVSLAWSVWEGKEEITDYYEEN